MFVCVITLCLLGLSFSTIFERLYHSSLGFIVSWHMLQYDILTRHMLAYARLIIREALRHGGLGWMEYDRVFRGLVAIDPSMAWNSLQPGLLASTVLSQPQAISQPRLFCIRCRESDQDTSSCVLAPIQQVTYTARSTPVGVCPNRRPETLQNICVNWIKGNVAGQAVHTAIFVLPVSTTTGQRIVPTPQRTLSTNWGWFHLLHRLCPAVQLGVARLKVMTIWTSQLTLVQCFSFCSVSLF